MIPDQTDLSVIIPTWNRQPLLAHTLEALTHQSTDEATFEVVVIDNNSADDTAEFLADVARDYPLPITVATETNPGTASAKNKAASLARGKALLFIGDDTEPATSNLMERHAELHRNSSENSLFVGRIDWTPKKAITPFMEWLTTEGPQFHFDDIEAGLVDPSSYFYGSHSSIKRSFFESTGGFDGRFRGAYEDVEYGDRLERNGATLEFHPELIVWHDHPTDLEQSLSRMERVGRSGAEYNNLYPDRPHPAIGAPSALRCNVLRAADPILRVTPGKKALWLRHLGRYARGYRAQLSNGWEGS